MGHGGGEGELLTQLSRAAQRKTAGSTGWGLLPTRLGHQSCRKESTRRAESTCSTRLVGPFKHGNLRLLHIHVVVQA